MDDDIYNLYDLHSDPKSLFGYSTRDYRIPELAWHAAIREPELRDLLEPTIAKSPEATYEYAAALGKRFKLGELVIIHNFHYAIKYFKRFFKPNRWPEFEKTITTPINSALFAMALDKPVPEKEKIIATSGPAAMMYVKFVLRGRFPEGENDIFSKDDARRRAYEAYLGRIKS